MAEHDSFPVDATETTVENSLRNVRENTDVFVMIVGARYGSIDPDTDKSVTNLEFLEGASAWHTRVCIRRQQRPCAATGVA